MKKTDVFLVIALFCLFWLSIPNKESTTKQSEINRPKPGPNDPWRA